VNGKQFLSAWRILSAASLAASLAVLPAEPAAAQGYPNRPVKIIMPFAPGGPTDFIIRLVADRLTATLGQAFVIENRPGGAGGTVGAKSVAIAEPDGYTLLFSSPGPLVTAAAVYKSLDYDPIRSFAPIAMLIYAPQMLVVNPSVPANSLPEFVAHAKSNPGKIAFGSSGYGTQPHMLGEMLKLAAGINIVHVPYRGAGQSVTDLVAGQVQMIFETTAILLPHVEGGRLRALAVATDTRSALLPNVPTTAESGYPKLMASFWSGLLAPAGTPAPIVGKLNGAVNEILKSTDAQAGLTRLSAEAKIGSPQDFAAFIAAETPRWAAIANETGIKVD
jgi:tripartite-type tricarboxylate transporter receptor subunit TctC